MARARVAAGRAPSLGLVPSGGTSGAGIQGSTARPAGWPRAAPRVGIRARPRAGGPWVTPPPRAWGGGHLPRASQGLAALALAHIAGSR